MILLSLNIRRVGVTLKQASMHRLLRKVKLDVIFLQEMLVDEEKACHFMLKFVPTLCSCAIISMRNSGGLLATSDPKKFLFLPSPYSEGNLVIYTSWKNNKDICLLNVYGPSIERKTLWDQVALWALLGSKNLIFVGYLKFTSGDDEAYGATTQLDNLVDYFKNLIQDHQLVDQIPDEVVPTWRNDRNGVEIIAKRPDRVLFSEILLIDVGRYRTWVDLPCVSNHALVESQFKFQ